MQISSSGYGSAREIHYLFVDGGALRGKIENVSRQLFDSQRFDIDFRLLAMNFTKVFYYDAVPVQGSDEMDGAYDLRIAEIRRMLDSASEQDRVHVFEGDLRKRKRRGNEQKKVDVALTVDMLTHSFRRNMHRATLLSGDLDFKPLIDAMVREGMQISLLYPIGETNIELIRAADTRLPLHLGMLRSFLTQESQVRFVIPEFKSLENQIDGSSHEIAAAERDGQKYAIHEAGGYFYLVKYSSGQISFIRHRDFANIRTFALELFNVVIRDTHE